MFDEAVYEQSAQQALENWPINVDELTLSSRSENVVYKATSQESENYALRIHRPGYNSIEELKSEVSWSEGLRDAGIYVPRHIKTKDGQHYAEVMLGPDKKVHYVGLIEWLEGDSLDNLIKTSEKSEIEDYYFKLGELMALVHNQSSSWKAPKLFIRRKWDADGLMGHKPLWGKFWATKGLNSEQQKLLGEARMRLHQELSQFGKGPSSYGVIHADLHAKNVLVQGEKLQIIDFDDCGYSWHSYEIAVAETDARSTIEKGTMSREEIRSALVNGYTSKRPLTAEWTQQLSALTMVRELIQLGWANDRPELIPEEFFDTYISKLCPTVEAYLSKS
ncbi:phosphotransferase [Gammaproteobacteria bacterium]|nr:phosphotransferase [Gammaproteobacteria bacterium]